jgi:hypothetical protein
MPCMSDSSVSAVGGKWDPKTDPVTCVPWPIWSTFRYDSDSAYGVELCNTRDMFRVESDPDVVTLDLVTLVFCIKIGLH